MTMARWACWMRYQGAVEEVTVDFTVDADYFTTATMKARQYARRGATPLATETQTVVCVKLCVEDEAGDVHHDEVPVEPDYTWEPTHRVDYEVGGKTYSSLVYMDDDGGLHTAEEWGAQVSPGFHFDEESGLTLRGQPFNGSFTKLED